MIGTAGLDDDALICVEILAGAATLSVVEGPDAVGIGGGDEANPCRAVEGHNGVVNVQSARS